MDYTVFFYNMILVYFVYAYISVVHNYAENSRILAGHFVKFLNCEPPSQKFDYKHREPDPDSEASAGEEYYQDLE